MRKIKPGELKANERASYWLALANEAAERGEKKKAERLYERAEKWLTKLNVITGQAAQ